MSIKNVTPSKRYKGGMYTCINPHKYIGEYPIMCRSSLEIAACKWMDTSTNVISWSSEPQDVVIHYIKDKKRHKYNIDAKFTLNNGEQYIAEIKPFAQVHNPIRNEKSNEYSKTEYRKNILKWLAAKEWAKQHGFIFMILTEKFINAQNT